MEKTIPPNAPQRIALIGRAPVYADEDKRFNAENPEREFVGISLNGKPVDWADAPVEWDGDLLLVDGLPYRWEHRRDSRRYEDWIYYSDGYRIQVGWQVLLSSPLNPQPHPNMPHPTWDREEAETNARYYVTKNRSAYNSKMTGQVVWQERPGVYGDPVAICDGAEYTRHDAGLAVLRGELLPFTYTDDEVGDAATPPTSEDPPAKEEPGTDNTTDPDGGQPDTDPPPTIVLEVRYQGTGASIIPTGEYLGSTAELVKWYDGRANRPPDDNVERLRLWLKERGYRLQVEKLKWLDKGHGPRRRREVYRLKRVARGHGRRKAYETIDRNYLRQYARENPIPRLPEAERLALYREKALAGEGAFAHCRDCPLVRNCPHQWGACDRKAEIARAKRAGRERPKLFVPGLVG